MQTTFTPKLILHGGAWNIPLELEEAHAKGLEVALAKVYPLLQSGKYDAMQAVVEAIKILEDDPTYDAGKGSFLNMKGEVEMDASLVDGTTMKSGAVACIQNVMHPIEVAQKVLQKSDHVLLVGRGALEFAKANGIPEVDPMDLLTEREIEFLKHIRENKEFKSVTVFDPKESQLSNHTIQESMQGTVEKTEGQAVTTSAASSASSSGSHDLYEEKRQHKMGTVGAVALDIHGNIVAGTSTGGVPKKLPGRSGDSPIIGSGTFADSSVAGASATGFGESIMTVQMTSTAIRWLEFGNIPEKYAKTDKVFQSNIYPATTQGQRAAQAAVQYLEDKVKGLGGLIMISKEGNEGKYAVTFNTGKMAVAYVETKQEDNAAEEYRIVSMVANHKS